MYVCGMTVYDYCHLGHGAGAGGVRRGRPLSAQPGQPGDLRTQHHRYRRQDHRPRERERRGLQPVTQRFTEHMHEDCRALGVLAPDLEPRATHYIEPIVSMVERLIETGAAYPGGERGCLLRRQHVPAYGRPVGSADRGSAQRRPGRDRRGQGRPPRLRAVEVVQARRAELGIAVGTGPARLAYRMLGDVDGVPGASLRHSRRRHGLAVSAPRERDRPERGRHRSKFVNVWMHNGFVRIDDEKMSKSLGNFFTLRGVLEHYPAEAVRCFMLSSHYRSPLNYSEDHLRQADSSVRRLYTALRGARWPPGCARSGLARALSSGDE